MLTSVLVTVDRGHRFSAGHAVANFWMKEPLAQNVWNPQAASFVPGALDDGVVTEAVLQELAPQPS